MTVKFSYSGIKTFEQCPRKYHHTRVLGDVVDMPGTAALYGTAVHKAAEDFTVKGEPIPAKFNYIRPTVEALAGLPGKHHAEIKLGLLQTEDGYAACDFDDPDYWWHGIADLLIVNGYRAICVDYKTGKNSRYADMRQLDLLAAAVFAHFSGVMQIKSALLYVDTDEVIQKQHVRTEMSTYVNVFANQLRRLERATETGVWNANPSGLCPWCPVKQCEFWRERR